MRFAVFGIMLLGLISVPVFFPPGAHASGMLSASPGFAFGARLDLEGQHLQPSLNAAAGLGLDWIAVDFNWAALMPDPNQLPNISRLNQVMEFARQSGTPVMLTLANAPAWAMTPHGPDPNITASLAISLARLYTGTLRAIELYPAVNTPRGWGAAPDPAGYASLFQSTGAALKAEGLEVRLITSLALAQEPGDVEDRAFLEGLYQQGAASWMQVVGVRLPALVGDPMLSPEAAAGQNHGRAVLRHFEILRQVMLQYQHASGLIWITGFTWPFEPGYLAPKEQAAWLNQAYQVLRSQLYIGAAFFLQLNPPASGTHPATGAYTSLVLPDASLHPVCNLLTQLTSLENNAQSVNFQGPISKKTPLKASIKP